MNVRGKVKCGVKFLMAVFVLCVAMSGRVFAWEDPSATLTVGTSTNTNVFNNPEDISDRVFDTGLRVVLPHTVTKKTKFNLEINYKQDWKQDQDKLNSRTSMVNLRMLHTYSKNLSMQAAYLYQDFEVFLASGINLVLQPKLTKTNSVKVDYTYLQKRFPNITQNGINQIIKLDYKVQLSKISSITPFIDYEKNAVPGSSGSEYKGPTAGLRYEFKIDKRLTLATSYDYRTRDYDSPSKATISSISAADRGGLVTLGWTCSAITAKQTTATCTFPNVTRTERRGQFTLGLKYTLQKNADLNLKYAFYKNDGASSDPGSNFGTTKSYKVNIFSISVSLRSLKMKRAPKEENTEENTRGEEIKKGTE